MKQRAILVFAEPIKLDLDRRGLPNFLRPLLDFRARADGVEADVHIFASGFTSATSGACVHRQQGDTFAERLEKAVEEVAALGYAEIVVIGRDCPLLRADDITRAFAELATSRMVLGPDHRGGCYLLAFHASDRHLLIGIRWKRNTDFAQLCARCPSRVVLPMKQDVDSWADVRLLARTGHRLATFVATILRVGTFAHEFFVDLPARRTRIRWQIPPPLPAL